MIQKFVSGKIVEDYVNDKFTQQFHKLDKNDPFYDVKLASLKQEEKEGLEAAKLLDEKKKKNEKKNYID